VSGSFAGSTEAVELTGGFRSWCGTAVVEMWHKRCYTERGNMQVVNVSTCCREAWSNDEGITEGNTLWQVTCAKVLRNDRSKKKEKVVSTRSDRALLDGTDSTTRSRSKM
jgi:hypothetical protein